MNGPTPSSSADRPTLDPFTAERLLDGDGEGALADTGRLPEVLDALRSPATPAELSGEAAVLDRMMAVLVASPVAKETHHMRKPAARFAAIAAAALVALGGVAAAATGTLPLPGPDRPSLQSTAEEPATTLASFLGTPTTTGAPTTGAPTSTAAVTTTTSAEGRDDKGTPGAAPSCEAAENHGAFVSGQAHERNDARGTTTTTAAPAAPTTRTAAPEPGNATAGRSDCGKPEAASKPGNDDNDDNNGAEAPDKPETKAPPASATRERGRPEGPSSPGATTPGKSSSKGTSSDD
jgi:hypothetical protein